MSQWGRARGFACEGGFAITVVPHVATKTWKPLTLDDSIDRLVVTDARGPYATKLDDLKSQYIGQPYRNWLNIRRP